jgi:hypothetical protein
MGEVLRTNNEIDLPIATDQKFDSTPTPPDCFVDILELLRFKWSARFALGSFCSRYNRPGELPAVQTRWAKKDI